MGKQWGPVTKDARACVCVCVCGKVEWVRVCVGGSTCAGARYDTSTYPFFTCSDAERMGT
jgi:hypothetical protein